MPGRDTQYQELAREAAERIDGDRELQRQLSLLPDEIEAENVEGQGEEERAVRGKGKQLSQLRQWLLERGCTPPEDQLAIIAGLKGGKDPVATAMADAERILSWAKAGAEPAEKKDGTKRRDRISLSQRLTTFQQCYTAQLRALDAILPYIAPKASPDVQVNQRTTIVMAERPAEDRAVRARDVTPRGGRMVPADVAYETERNQDVSAATDHATDGEGRTE